MIAEKIKYLKECMEDIVIKDPTARPLFIKYYREGEPLFCIKYQDQNLIKNNNLKKK